MEKTSGACDFSDERLARLFSDEPPVHSRAQSSLKFLNKKSARFLTQPPEWVLEGFLATHALDKQ
jgi:hypothetical protein